MVLCEAILKNHHLLNPFAVFAILWWQGWYRVRAYRAAWPRDRRDFFLHGEEINYSAVSTCRLSTALSLETKAWQSLPQLSLLQTPPSLSDTKRLRELPALRDP